MVVINYWSAVIAREGKARHFFDVLRAHGYPAGPRTRSDSPPRWIRPMRRGAAYHRRSSSAAPATRGTCGWPSCGRARSVPGPPARLQLRRPVQRHPAAGLVDANARRLGERRRSAPAGAAPEQLKSLVSYLEVLVGRPLSLARLREVVEQRNRQMDLWIEARDLVARARPCPVSLRDELALYQVTWQRGTETSYRLLTTTTRRSRRCWRTAPRRPRLSGTEYYSRRPARTRPSTPTCASGTAQ